MLLCFDLWLHKRSDDNDQHVTHESLDFQNIAFYASDDRLTLVVAG